MALQAATTQTNPTAQMVGNAFVEQYYHILHQSPELVYKFYQDSSVISRPDAYGEMTSVTTMLGINEKILSLNYADFKAEIKTADAQNSCREGVIVLVTGCLTGGDNLKRKFVQTFFLAPQEHGYYVLNDVFRYIEDNESLESQPNGHTDVGSTLHVISDSEPASVCDLPLEYPKTSVVEEVQNIVEKSYDPPEHEIHPAQEDKAVVESPSDTIGNDDYEIVEYTSARDDAPKKSYASIVKVTNGSSAPRKIYVPTNNAKVAPKEIEVKSARSAPPASEPETSAPSNSEDPERGSTHEEAEEHTIYIRNLPLNMTAAQLRAEFEKFGTIKEGGIQVRINKQEGYCFGFVEFQTLSSMNSAIQASPMTIAGRQAYLEKKKATRNRVISGRGRFPIGRGGFRSDSFRGRGNYGQGGRSFGWNEFGNRNEYSGRGRSIGIRRGEGYQQVRGRGGRYNSGPRHSNVPLLNTKAESPIL